MTAAPDRQLGRRLHMLSCTFCRSDKKKCNPEHRTWPQKCTRCQTKGLACSEPARKNRARKESSRGARQSAEIELNNPLPPIVQSSSATSAEEEKWTWNLTDLHNALGLLQLITVEYLEHKAASNAAKLQLPKLWSQPYTLFQDRLCELGRLHTALRSTLMSQVISRLQDQPDTPTRLVLEAAIPTIAEPDLGLRLQRQNKTLAATFEEQARRVIENGQLCLGITFLSKAMSLGRKAPDINLVNLIESHDIPQFMDDIAQKFGLKAQSTSPDTWKWPSMLFPSLRELSGHQAMEGLLIKNWIGFDFARGLLGNPRLQGTSSEDWKQVFRYMCRHPKEPAKRDKEGRTSLHLAVLLNMPGEVERLLQFPHFDPSQQDKAQRTALHLAAIIGHENICDILLSADRASGSILLEDYAGRLPVWYAAKAGREALFQKLLDKTKLYRSLPEICSHRDKDGYTLLQYAIAHGLDCFQLTPWTVCTDIENFYPDRRPVPVLGTVGQTLLTKNSLASLDTELVGQTSFY